MQGIVELAKKELRLPAQLGFPLSLPSVVEQEDDPAMAVVTGLLLAGAEVRQSAERSPFQAIAAVGPTVARLRGWFRTLLP